MLVFFSKMRFVLFWFFNVESKSHRSIHSMEHNAIRDFGSVDFKSFLYHFIVVNSVPLRMHVKMLNAYHSARKPDKLSLPFISKLTIMFCEGMVCKKV